MEAWREHVRVGREFIQFVLKDVVTMMLVAFSLAAVVQHRY